MRQYLNQVTAIVWKDMITELKTKEMLSMMFVFSVLVILIFIFSINLRIVNANDVGPGVLWVAFVFSGTIGLNRSFTIEKENGCLQGIMLTPVDRTAIYFAKTISNLIFLLIMEALILPVFMIFFNVFKPMLIFKPPRRLGGSRHSKNTKGFSRLPQKINIDFLPQIPKVLPRVA